MCERNKSYPSTIIRKSFHLVLLLFAFFISPKDVRSQATEPYKIEYELSEEITATVIHGIMEDSIGFVWLATDKGIVRFDGETYTQYDCSHLAVSNEFFGISVDREERIWFFSSEGALVRFDYSSETIIPSPYNPGLIGKIKGVIQKIHWSVDRFYIQCNDNYLWEIEVLSDTEIESKDLNAPYQHKCFLADSNGEKALINTNVRMDKRSIEYKSGEATLFEIKFPLEGGFFKTAHCQTIKANWVLSNNKLIKTAKDLSLISEFPFSVFQTPNGLMVEENGTIWIGGFHDGVYKLEESESSEIKLKSHFLQKQTVTSFFRKSKNHGLWIATLGTKFYFVPYASGEQIISNENVKYLSLFDDDVLQVSRNGNSHYYSNSERKNITGKTLIVEPYRSYFYGDTLTFCSDQINLKNWKESGEFFQKAVPCNIPKILTARMPKNFKEHLIIDYPDQLNDARIRFQKEEFTARFKKFPVGMRDIAATESGTLFYITFKNHIGRLTKGSNHFNLEKVDYSFMPLRIEPSSDSTAIIISNNGVFSYRANAVRSLDTVFWTGNLSMTNAKRLNDQWWFSADDGLYKVDSNDSFRLILKFKDIRKNKRINDFIFVGKTLFVATENGVISIDTAEIELITPSLKITCITQAANGKILNKPLLLKSDSSDIKIEWSLFDYSWNFKREYRWRILPNETWNYTASSRLNLTSITQGTHLFEVQYKSKGNVWSTSETINLKILPPFYLQWWFIILVSIVLFGVIFAFVYIRSIQLKKRYRLKENLLIAQNQALATQLNPHFIFNSMNTISSFIAQEDDMRALKYIAKLSVLMRRIFSNAQQPFVSLKKELDSVFEYLEMEQLRFGDKLRFEFIDQSNVNLDSVKVPSMLIQPFVENAIKHGILVQDNGGSLTIKVEEEPENILVFIQDDGPGIDREAAKKRKETSESAMSAIQKRLDIIQSLKQDGARLNVVSSDKGVTIKLTFKKSKS
jgi:two-component sensor histidine kinase